MLLNASHAPHSGTVAMEHSRSQDKDGWGKRRDESRTCLLDSILEQCLWM